MADLEETNKGYQGPTQLEGGLGRGVKWAIAIGAPLAVIGGIIGAIVKRRLTPEQVAQLMKEIPSGARDYALLEAQGHDAHKFVERFAGASQGIGAGLAGGGIAGVVGAFSGSRSAEVAQKNHAQAQTELAKQRSVVGEFTQREIVKSNSGKTITP
jgi:hypothetical protein